MIATAKEIVEKLSRSYPDGAYVDRDHLNARAAEVLPELLSEIEKWQAIAIEERASNIYYETYMLLDSVGHDWASFPEEACHMRSKQSFYDQAASELVAEAGQWVRMTPEQKAAIWQAVTVISRWSICR